MAEDAGAAEAITIKVKGQDNEEMMFKVKKTTKMSKIFEAYASRKGVARTSLRFTFDGQRLQDDTTPKFLEMEDQDQIEAHIEALGGM
jgi:small ubiquitin-related modifier